MWKLIDCGTHPWFILEKQKYFHCVYAHNGEYKKTIPDSNHGYNALAEGCRNVKKYKSTKYRNPSPNKNNGDVHATGCQRLTFSDRVVKKIVT